MPTTPTLGRSLPWPAPRTIGLLGLLLAIEIALVAGYVVATGSSILSIRHAAYPFVWVNVAVLAVRAVDVPAPTSRRSAVAFGVAVGYLVVLGWTSGLIGPGTGGAPSARLVPALPGWGPVVLVDGPIALALVPFETIGYLSLSILVYVGVARAAAGVLSGLVGLVTCVSCVGPVIAAVLSGFVGGASTAIVGATTGAYAYDLSTALFVLTVAALWRTLGLGR